MKWSSAVFVPYRSFEVRQHIVPTPARIPQLRPMVVVASIAAYVHHPVDGARTAQCLTAWPVELAILQHWNRIGAEAPVVALGLEHLAHAGGRPDPEVIGGRGPPPAQATGRRGDGKGGGPHPTRRGGPPRTVVSKLTCWIL